MVAVHALVPAADIWRLLPELEAAGGSSILVRPRRANGLLTWRASRPSSRTCGCAATPRSASGRVRLDGVEPARAEPSAGLPADAVLDLADSVRRWHEAQRPADLRLEVRPGVELERRWVPLASVGIYVPRGLVSTLVMCAVPALVAGVDRIVVATPPDGAGLVAAAAELLGVDEVWALGGPPAIAAFAYGTETIPRVDKICGPGGALRQRGEAPRLARGRDRPARRPVRGRRSRRGAARTRRSRSSSSPPRASTAPTPCAGSWRSTATRRARSRRRGRHRTRAPRRPRRRRRGARRAGPERRRDLRRGVVVGRGRRLRHRRQPRPPDRRLGARGRRHRARDLPQAGDDPAADGGRTVVACARPSRRSRRLEGMPAHAAAVRR